MCCSDNTGTLIEEYLCILMQFFFSFFWEHSAESFAAFPFYLEKTEKKLHYNA